MSVARRLAVICGQPEWRFARQVAGAADHPKAATLVITGAADSKPAIEVITGSGGPKPNENSKPANEVTTGSLPPAAAQETDRKRSSSVSEAFRETILRELSRGRNAMGIWQDLVDSHGFAGGYQSVKRLVRTLRGAASPEARVIIETRPGEECQVDYGTGPMVRDPDSGKYRRTRLFVLTLGCSRKCVRLLAFRSSARVWVERIRQSKRTFSWGSGCDRLVT